MLTQDLLDMPPIWPLSCYGLEKLNANLLSGDVSPEEARYEAYKAASMGGDVQKIVTQRVSPLPNAFFSTCSIPKFFFVVVVVVCRV
jgi:hypothetical protein